MPNTTTIRRNSFDGINIVVTFAADGTAMIGDRLRSLHMRPVSARVASAVLEDVAITTHAELPALIKAFVAAKGDRVALRATAARRAARASAPARPRSRPHGHVQRPGSFCICGACLHTGVSSRAWAQ